MYIAANSDNKALIFFLFHIYQEPGSGSKLRERVVFLVWDCRVFMRSDEFHDYYISMTAMSIKFYVQTNNTKISNRYQIM